MDLVAAEVAQFGPANDKRIHTDINRNPQSTTYFILLQLIEMSDGKIEWKNPAETSKNQIIPRKDYLPVCLFGSVPRWSMPRFQQATRTHPCRS